MPHTSKARYAPPAGNLLQDGTGVGTHTYQWDAENRLKSVDVGATASYAYNALGLRVMTYLPNNVRSFTYYDAFGNPALIGGIPNTWAEYPLMRVAGRQIAVWEQGPNGSGSFFVHSNPLGSWSQVSK